jgi:hypothetical protein
MLVTLLHAFHFWRAIEALPRHWMHFFVILVLPLPKRPMLFLEFWFYRFQDAGCFFGNSGSANQRHWMLVLSFWFSQSHFCISGSATFEMPDTSSVILVQPIKEAKSFFVILVQPLSRHWMLFL